MAERDWHLIDLAPEDQETAGKVLERYFSGDLRQEDFERFCEAIRLKYPAERR